MINGKELGQLKLCVARRVHNLDCEDNLFNAINKRHTGDQRIGCTLQ